MLRFGDIVFGPVRSRRLGSSLGVNVLPTDGKLCNFDCIYCECGGNVPVPIFAEPLTVFIGKIRIFARFIILPVMEHILK